MKVFITGVAGFLGSHLAEAFLNEGHEVWGCDNLIGGYRDNVPNGVCFFVANCADTGGMKRLLVETDVVYHCACTAYEGLSVFSPALVSQNTYQITASVLSASIANGVKRFVYCSSMARYGAQPYLRFTEDLEPAPQDPYGIAKYASELLVSNLSKVHGMEYVIAVPHNIIGPRQKYDDPYRNVASIMINRMLQGKQPIIYGDGKQIRCFSFIEDVVTPLMAMSTAAVVGETINVGPDEEPVSINELAQVLADLLSFDLDPIYVPGRPQEVKYATCSAEKARRLLGYETTTTLREGLSRMIEWIKERGTRPFDYHLPLEIINDQTPETWKNQMI